MSSPVPVIDPAVTPRTTARPIWPVILGSGALIIALALYAVLAPEHAASTIGTVVNWVSGTFGWYFVLTAGIVFVFVLVLACSNAGAIRFGGESARPAYRTFTWGALLFAAGIGIDLMFFSVAEPVTQYLAPPTGGGETVAAARQAIVWTVFHYGPLGFAMYALMGAGFAYAAYNRGLPLNLRSVLQPLFGSKTEGWIGHSADILTILGSVFGLGTTLGIGVVQLAYGAHLMLGVSAGTSTQIALIMLAVIVAICSTLSGVERGIRRLSQLNVWLTLVLLVWITVSGDARLMLEGLIMNAGDFVSAFPSMVFETFAWERPDAWMQGWTIFFWAWWAAWAPFVGMFLARISRGRTVRQFVFGTLLIPVAFILLFVSVFGNSALALVRGGDEAFADQAMNLPEEAFFGLLGQYPGAPFLIAIALLTGLLFYVTSADSGALVLANLSAHVSGDEHDGPKWLRVFWAVATGALTLGMLLVGGVPALQQATVIAGLPVSILLFLVMGSLYRQIWGAHRS